MANIILKLIPNKWDDKHFFSFIKKSENYPKDQHFLAHNNNGKEIVAGDFWECFIWNKREIEDKVLYKVIPHKKIDSTKLKEERRRVNEFNKNLANMEKFIGEDFDKIIFIPDNKPFLKAKIHDRNELAAKYPDFTFLEDNGNILARPPALKSYSKPPAKKGDYFDKSGFKGKKIYKKLSSTIEKPKPVLNPLYKQFKIS